MDTWNWDYVINLTEKNGRWQLKTTKKNKDSYTKATGEEKWREKRIEER